MDIVYTPNAPKDLTAPAIFLAGPTARPENPVPSWRTKAVEELRELGFQGTVFVPEPSPDGEWPDYEDQVAWEHRWLDFADCVLFWIPRDMVTLPAMTTNIEYGMFMRTGKLVIGAPVDAPHSTYIFTTAKMYGTPAKRTLRGTLRAAMDKAAQIHTVEGRILARMPAWRGRFVHGEIIKYLDRTGQVRTYESIRRTAQGTVAAIIAITTDNEVVLNKIFRIPQNTHILEYPAGLPDHPGEDTGDLAIRELLEETGYGGGSRPVELLVGPADSGLNVGVMAYYLTTGVTKLQEPTPEATEEIETILVPLDKFGSLCLNPPAGCTADIKMLAPLDAARQLGLI